MPSQRSSEFTVTLLAPGPNTIPVLVRVRALLGLPPAECKRLVGRGPVVLLTATSYFSAERLKKDLSALGASVIIEPAIPCTFDPDDDLCPASPDSPLALHPEELVIDLVSGRGLGPNAIRIRHLRTGESVGQPIGDEGAAVLRLRLLHYLAARVASARATRTVDQVQLPPDWSILTHEEARPLETEIRRELPPGHLLERSFGMAVARRLPQDDVLVRISAPTVAHVAVVHLTWAKETDHRFPFSIVYPSTRAFREAYARDFLL